MYSPRIAYLEHAIATKTPFACYRMPNETDFYTLLLGKDSCIPFSNFGDISNEKGMVLTPFSKSKETPSLLLKYDEVCVNDKGFRGDMFLTENREIDNSVLDVVDEHKESYISSFTQMHELLGSDELKKIVLSKTISFENIDETQAIYTYHNLARTYKNAFVYWVYLPKKGIVWMGATPELLLKQVNDNLLTMSLAGTKLPNENWSEKEREEQQIVTDYIRRELCDYELEISDIDVLKHGEIEHFVNYITVKRAKLAEVIEKLHPTPAVCGYPKDKAFEAIKSIEKHSREYYSGIVGVFNMKETAMFVNLRCMKLAGRKLRLFVGGGLTKNSQLESEWQEVERKADTIRKSFS